MGQKHFVKLKNMAGVQCPVCWHETTFVISSLPFAEVQPCGTVWLNYSQGKSWPFSRGHSRARKWHAGRLESRTGCLSSHFVVSPFFYPGSWKPNPLYVFINISLTVLVAVTEAEKKNDAFDKIVGILNSEL